MAWFTWTWYGRVGQPLTAFDRAVELVKDRLSKYPQFAGTPLAIGEFAVLHDEEGKRLWSGDTTEWAASFYAAMADRVYTHGIRQVYEWAETTSGVPHPRAHVIGMLKDMSGGQRLAVDVQAASEANCGAIGCRKGKDVWVLVYNHHASRNPKRPESVSLALCDPRMEESDTWTISEWRIDSESSSWGQTFEADCEAAGVEPLPKSGRYEGSPSRRYGEEGECVFRQNRDKYARIAELPMARKDEKVGVAAGRVDLTIDMPGHSVRLLKVSPPR